MHVHRFRQPGQRRPLANTGMLSSWIVWTLGAVLCMSGSAFAGSFACVGVGTVSTRTKISNTSGGLGPILDSADFFGVGVVSIGDLNGDGVGDLAVGAEGDDDGGSSRGAVYILFMNADGTVGSFQKISSTSGGFAGPLDDGDTFGSAVGSLGDINGDGTIDLAVGAAHDDDGGTSRGAVWILFMRADGTILSSQKISDTVGGFNGVLLNFYQFGNALAGLGDIDLDGTPDLAVGVSQDDTGGPNRGAVYILRLTPDGTVKGEQRIAGGEGGFTGVIDDSDLFGWSIASLGDLDADGVRDLIVGAVGDDDGGFGRGALWGLFLNANGSVRSHFKISDTAGGFDGVLRDDDFFGSSISSFGDLDGNGIIDLAVGAQNDDDGGSNNGAVWIVLLNANGTVRAEQKISEIAGGLGVLLDDDDTFGSELTFIGDMNSDGSVELAVAALQDDDGATQAGAVYILGLNNCLAPRVTLQPQSVLLTAGGGLVLFQFAASGQMPMQFQWSKDGVDLLDGGGVTGSSQPTLMIDADESFEGLYSCVVSNAFGSASSQQAILGVRACPGDADGNAAVNFGDITAVLSLFGQACP